MSNASAGDAAATPDALETSRGSREALVRRFFDTYHAADRAGFESFLDPEFTFTSPYDDHIDKGAYFERCWPAAGTFELFSIEQVVVDGDVAIVHYQARTQDGEAVRNVERLRFAGDRVREVEVYFGLPSAPAATARDSDLEAIRTLLEQRQEALSMKDTRLLNAKQGVAPVEFGMAPPLVLKADFERTAREWFKSWAGFIDWDTKPIQVEMSGDVAFVSALEHMEGRRVDGEDTDLWFRTTLGLRKVDGEWKIVHEHQSVPFAMDGSLKAAVDLKPDQLDDESSIPLAPSGDRSGLH